MDQGNIVVRCANCGAKNRIPEERLDQGPICGKYGIQSIPTMLLFKNGNHVDSLVGALPKHEIERHLGTILAT